MICSALKLSLLLFVVCNAKSIGQLSVFQNKSEAHSPNELSIDAFNTIEAESYNAARGKLRKERSRDSDDHRRGYVIGNIHNNAWMEFNDVDFRYGASKVQVRLASTMPKRLTGAVDFIIDSFHNKPFATVSFRPTGSTYIYRTFQRRTYKRITGSHNLYVRFRGHVRGEVCKVNWFVFAP